MSAPSASTKGASPASANLLQTTRSGNDKISFHLKTSIFTRRVTLDTDKLALGLVKQLAVAFLKELYFQQQSPSNSYQGDYIRKQLGTSEQLNSLYDRIILRKYDPLEESFMPFNSVGEIQPESYIVIEVSEKQHLLSLANQQAISMSQHQSVNPSQAHTSATSVPTSIANLAPVSQAAANTSSTNSHQSHQANPINQSVRISHNFKPESFLLPTLCAACTTIIKGVFRQGFQCTSCKRNFCPKCKSLAEANGDSCLSQQPHQPATSAHNQSAIVSSITTSTAASAGVLVSGAVQSGAQIAHQQDQSSATSKPADHANMAKRKSANNLLHFNIANPFKSLHSNQQQQQTGQSQSPIERDAGDKSKPNRSSAGALDSVLQQLSKMRATHQNQPIVEVSSTSDSNLLVAQPAHLSSSHQNLYTSSDNNQAALSDQWPDNNQLARNSPASAQQSPKNSLARHPNQQLSNSARSSAHDITALCLLQGNLQQASAGHAFICMDWIQLDGDQMCQVCNKVLKVSTSRVQQQAPPYMCKNCKAQVHKQCIPLAMANCLDRIAESSRAAAKVTSNGDEASDQEQDGSRTSVRNSASNASRSNIGLHRLAPSVKHVKRPDATKPIIEGWLKHTTLSRDQSRRHYWRLDQTDITLYENDTSTRYFKAIALDKITRVMSAQSLPKRVKEDVLTSGLPASPETGNKSASKSANTSPAKSPELAAQMKAMFAFELTTGSFYLVQASSESEASRWREVLTAATTPTKVPLESKTVEEKVELKDDLQKQDQDVSKVTTTDKLPQQDKKVEVRLVMQERPIGQTKQNPLGNEPTNNKHHHHAKQGVFAHQHRASPHIKTYTDPSRSRLYNRPRITIHLDTSFVPKHLIECKYLIEVDPIKGYGYKELGSGQFGKVYAAITDWKLEDKLKGIWSGIPVAIKEISKARFDLRQQEKLKNEANILSRLDHQGVIILERVHDLTNEIYIVMEQLEDDMLEMIVSTEDKRLSERVTKFLTYQILEALKYLHSKNIAHCDLKPENVLLVESRSQFPQIKLCDFGFAKIIEENSFRSSLVGTPAYLAPEVVRGERYNRSVDLWSVGVIVYVSLSGEFPFNESENIHDQISRANFMYPDQPWARISQQAKNFINSLLRVNCDKRLSANRAQMDEWIQVSSRLSLLRSLDNRHSLTVPQCFSIGLPALVRPERLGGSRWQALGDRRCRFRALV